MLNLMRFQKRPLHVTAVQITTDNIKDVAHWCGGVVQSTFANQIHTTSFAANRVILQDRYIQIYHDHGSVLASPGDWVVRYDDKSHAVFKDDEFERTFEFLDSVTHPDQHALDLDL